MLKESIETSSLMARYENIRSYLWFYLSILQAASYHCSAILANCDKFAKKFCICLVAYCSNSKEMETIVKESIKKVAATRLNVEHLSKYFRLSWFLVNYIAEGTDVTRFLYEYHSVAPAVIFLMIDSVSISLFVLYIHANYILKWEVNSKGHDA